MAASFDELPLYDQMVDKDGNLTPIWRDALSYLFQNLVGYMNQYGVLLPQVTTMQTTSIINPILGAVNFNTTTKEAQLYLPAGWKNISHS